MQQLITFLKAKPMLVYVVAFALLGSIILGGSFAATSPLYSVAIGNVQVYPATAVTQQQRVSVTVHITNNAASTLPVSPGLQMELIDTTGRTYPMTADYIPAGQIIGGLIAAGATTTYTIDFNVTPGATPQTFVFQPNAAEPALKVGV